MSKEGERNAQVVGEFKRVDSVFRNFVSQDHPIYQPEADRYHLYISLACPWANGTYALLKFKGLDKLIGVSIVHPTWQRTRPDDQNDTHCGWVFRSPADSPVIPPSGYGSISCRDCIPDHINGTICVRDLYDISNATTGRYTVPILWDKKTSTIVNNESTEILRIFNSSFNDLLDGPGRAVNLYPTELQADAEALNEWVYHSINNGVYRCGFAQSQAAYDIAIKELFESLDRVEDILSKKRYLCGEKFTWIDLRLFMTLIRFDEVYVVYFKTNKKPLSQYTHITDYMRELYQMPVLSSTINMDHIKKHYFTSHPTLNTYSIIPAGPDVLANMTLAHNRERLSPLA